MKDLNITHRVCDVGGMRKQQNIMVGNRGEKLAVEYLQRKGYKLWGRNYRSKWGEIDIVCSVTDKVARIKAEKIMVFVEVKTKTSDRYGAPWEMVSAWKIAQVKRMGEVWCREFGWEGRCRMDVVGVNLNELSGEVEKIEHYESVEG